MKHIGLHSVLPQAFAHESDLHSEVWNCDVVFERGRKYLIEAGSGMGKSTLCSYLIGYRHDYSGQLLFDGKDAKVMTVFDWGELRRNQVSYLFQELRLFPELTALENVSIKNRLTSHVSSAQVNEWFERLEIADKRDVRIGRMSFGQQQRVALIRALAQPFDFMLLDEPVSHLDDHCARAMASLLSEEVARQGAGVIATSIGKHLELDYDKILKL